MKIQLTVLIPLCIVMIVNIWQIVFPSYQFMQTSCIIGNISLPVPTLTTECSSCYTFPMSKHQTGKILIRQGTPEQQKLLQYNTTKQNNHKVWVSLYYQQSCVEYECPALLNDKNFKDGDVLKEAELREAVSYRRFISEIWSVDVGYDNHARNSVSRNVIENFVVYLFGNFIPAPLLPHHRLSYSMALKLRYTQPHPEQPNNTPDKPIVKVSINQANESSSLLSISLIIFYTLVVKLGVHSHKYGSLYLFILTLTFLSPYLFSLLCLILFIVRRPAHFIGLAIYAIALGVDLRGVLALAVAVSAGLQAKGGNRFLGTLDFVWLCLLATLAVVLDIQSVYSSAFVILYILCLEDTAKQYQQLRTKQQQKQGIQLKEYQPMVYHQ